MILCQVLQETSAVLAVPNKTLPRLICKVECEKYYIRNHGYQIETSSSPAFLAGRISYPSGVRAKQIRGRISDV